MNTLCHCEKYGGRTILVKFLETPISNLSWLLDSLSFRLDHLLVFKLIQILLIDLHLNCVDGAKDHLLPYGKLENTSRLSLTLTLSIGFFFCSCNFSPLFASLFCVCLKPKCIVLCPLSDTLNIFGLELVAIKLLYFLVQLLNQLSDSIVIRV